MSNIIWFLIIGLVAGWLAGQVMKGRGFGLIGNLIVGVLGALIGGFLLGPLLSGLGIIGAILTAAIGAIILLFVIGLVRR